MPQLKVLREGRQTKEPERWSVEYVAYRMGVTARRVHQWEAGTARPTDGQLRDLAELYGVTKRQIRLPAMTGVAGSKLRAARERHQLSMAEVGDALGISRQAVLQREQRAQVDMPTAREHLAAIERLAEEFAGTEDD